MNLVHHLFRRRPGQVKHAANPADRRASPRRTPEERRGWLGWWEGAEFMSVPACLQDISRTGVRLLVEQQPPRAQDAWFCLYDGNSTVGIECEVVGVGEGLAGLHVLRISFHETCPDRLYELALRGSPSAPEIEALPFPPSASASRARRDVPSRGVPAESRTNH